MAMDRCSEDLAVTSWSSRRYMSLPSMGSHGSEEEKANCSEERPNWAKAKVH